MVGVGFAGQLKRRALLMPSAVHTALLATRLKIYSCARASRWREPETASGIGMGRGACGERQMAKCKEGKRATTRAQDDKRTAQGRMES